MYVRNEDHVYLDRLFTSLDNERAHDFMELLLMACSEKTGNDEYMITVRSPKEISDLAIPENHIISREMVDATYRSITQRNYEEA